MYSMGNTRASVYAIGNDPIVSERSIIPERTVTHGEKALKREEYVRWVLGAWLRPAQKGTFATT